VAVAFQPGNLARGAGSAPSKDVFPTLKADHGRGLSDQMPHVLCMAHGQGGAEIASERRTTLTCNHEAPIIALQDTSGRDKAQNGKGWNDDGASYTLDAAATQGVAYAFQPRIARNGRGDMGELVNALTAQAGETGKGDAAPCVAVCVTGEVTHTLKAEGFDGSEDGTGRGQPIVAAFSNAGAFGAMRAVDVGDPLRAAGGDTGPGGETIALQEMAVRRLTPTECARLQGFPDQWARIPWRGKPAEQCPDGPQYKAYGNSMAVPCMAWIGSRIKMVLEWRATA